MYIITRMYSGANLALITDDLNTYLPQISELGREEQALQIQMYHQTCHCLMGFTNDPTVMSGEVIRDAEKFEQELRAQESTTAFAIFLFLQSFLSSIFGSYDRGAKLALEKGESTS